FWSKPRLQFKGDQLFKTSVGLGEIAGSRPAAYGDFNNDKNTDVFMLSDSQRILDLYLWNGNEQLVFSKLASATINLDITNVVPGDYNYDGQLDVLLMVEKSPSLDSKADEIKMLLYLGDAKTGFSKKPIVLPSAKSAHPIVFDYNGDMKPDFLGYQFSSSGSLKVWSNIANGTTSASWTSSTPLPDASSLYSLLANPHSSAFVDLNGDCLPDLFLVCQESSDDPINYQMWINSNEKDAKFTYYDGGKLSDYPSSALVSFVDVDSNGSIDLVYPECKGTNDCKINIVYNYSKKEPNKTPSTSNQCIKDDQFDLDIKNGEANGNKVVVDISGNVYKDEMLLSLDKSFSGKYPLPIRFGDMDFDTYPDAMAIMTKKKGGSTTDSDANLNIRLFANVACTSDKKNLGCNDQAIKNGRRTFDVMKPTNKWSALSDGITNPRAAHFFDIGEDGTVDIIVTYASESGKDAKSKVQPIYNNFYNDAYFLKAVVSNGVDIYSKSPYGVNYAGASLKYSVVDTSGKKRFAQTAQLTQSAYLASQTPYVMIGLGRTNNYVEDMYVGTSRRQTSPSTRFGGLVPNAQVVVLPYQPKEETDPSSWRLELYINPGEYTLWVFVSMVTCVVLLLGIVIMLLYFERRDDRREKARSRMVLNFDAL
ncbi:hypothetical protein GQ42DRAFT_113404, partial [Ramicandelaber brevisporus]